MLVDTVAADHVLREHKMQSGKDSAGYVSGPGGGCTAEGSAVLR